MNTKRISKFLSLVLRHKPETINITLDDQGWVEVEELIEKCTANKMPLDLKTLKYVVENNNKKRFAFSDDERKIRASQGHSVKIDLGYESTTPPKHLFHGTASRFIDSIRQTGLKKRDRHHVHLSIDAETATNVGSRHGKPIILSLDAEAMHRDGYEFFVSKNGVWLTDHVPAKYLDFPE